MVVASPPASFEPTTETAWERWVDQRAIPFDRYLAGTGMYFLATTTNLTMGRLEVLGEQQLDQAGISAFLLDGLLASCAFPGVFRRWSRIDSR
jgi:predicted acylesterase/phospholipase RssA